MFVTRSGSAGLVNADLADTEHLLHFLDEREWLHDAVSERDATALRRFVHDLRPIFEASDAGDEEEVVDRLNALLAKHPVTPYIAGHAAPAEAGTCTSPSRQSRCRSADPAECVMGLATLVVDLRADPPRGLRRHPVRRRSSSTRRRTSPAGTAPTGAPPEPTSRPTGPAQRAAAAS